MAYVKRIPIKTNLRNSIKYILNPEKTDENILISVNNCSLNLDLTYKLMERTKEEYNKTDKVQGYHFIQSFNEEENITPDIAHEVGKKWADKFLKDYEYVLATHKDKKHIHNHIVINSVSYKDGRKYLKNDKELESIRNLSDRVCKEYGLSIIKVNKKNRNKSYKEWKSSKKGISWKDKIKIDINETIKKSKDYENFIYLMKEKNYELKYGDIKYNTFRHPDMGRNIRGKTLGEDYTEEKIKNRIKEYNQNKIIYLNKYRKKEDLQFDEEKFYKKSFSNREIIKGDIDLSIQEANSYEKFLESMKNKGYILRYGDVKYNTFRHKDMKRASRGITIGEDYTEDAIKDRIETKDKVKEAFKNKDNLSISRNTYFNKRYLNSKFKYLNHNTIKNTNRSREQQEKIDNYYNSLRNLKLENRVYDLSIKYKIENRSDLREKLNIISQAVGRKKEEYNDRLDLLKLYIDLYKDYTSGNTQNLESFKNLEELETRIRYQKEVLDENIKDISKYEKIQKDLRFINYQLKDKELER